MNETEINGVAYCPDFHKLIEVGVHPKAASRRILVTCSRNQGQLRVPLRVARQDESVSWSIRRALAITSAAAGTCYGILGEIRGSSWNIPCSPSETVNNQ